MKRKKLVHDYSQEGYLQWSDPKIVSDVLGSYTGVPLDPAEKPIQDADDL